MRCLIVDDETSIVQFSDLEDETCSAGKSIILFGDSSAADAVGAAPAANSCKKDDDFKDLVSLPIGIFSINDGELRNSPAHHSNSYS